MNQLNAKPKKSLGQNFLNNKKILEEICNAAELSEKDTVLEIGPGHGSLTQALSEIAGKVIAVEKDRYLIAELQNKFAEQGKKNVQIIEGDILRMSPSQFPKNFKIVANIPYYITAKFLRNFLSSRVKPSSMVLMVQYEVAKRITARPPDMNLLALSVQAYGKTKFVQKVPKKFFSPAPKVDSAIIKISEISGAWFKENEIDEKEIFEIWRKAFQQKRKMLRHSLKNIDLPENFEKLRPEELSLENWAGLLNGKI